MRPLVIAPADVNPHTGRIDVAKRVVQRLDMHGRDLNELVVAEISEQHMARERKVRTVELQIEAGTDNGLVFLLHRIGQRREIGLARGVVLVLQEQRDHTRRSRIHKAASGTMRCHAGLQIVDVGLQFALSLGGHFAGAHRAGILRRAA